MKTNRSSVFLSSALGFALLSASAHAAILSVDFGAVGPESGFQLQNSQTALYSTSLGDITVDTGTTSFFPRGSSGVNQDLYGDFTFTNNGATGFTFSLSGGGILADTAYELKFWSYDSNTTNPSTVSYNGTNGSTGSLDITFDSGAGSGPSTLDQYAGTATFTSNNSGVLDILVTSNAEGPRINGFEIVPEPSAALLGGLGALLLLRRRR